MNLKEIYKEMSKKNYSELVKLGKGCYNKIIESLISELKFEEKEAIKYLISFTAFFVNADKKFSNKEYQMIVDVAGINNLTFTQFTNYAHEFSNPIVKNNFKNSFKLLSNQVKNYICTYAVCIFAVDGEISKSEQDIFDWLLFE